MKKNKLIFLLLGCVILWSCTQPTNIITQDDTVIKLDTPKIEGIAYPGVNYIYWSNVQNAFNGYDLRVYRIDDGKNILIESESKHFPKNTTYYKDTNISDGEKKRYEVVASGDQKGRAVFYSESSAGDVTLTGIVPSLSTKPLDFEEYEKNYNADDITNNKLSSSNISLVKDEKLGFYRVSFPVKPYLKYKVFADYGNTYEIYGVHDVFVGEYSDISAPLNSTATISGVADHSGTYKITIEVTSANGKYIGFNEIKSFSTIEFETLELLDDTFEYEISFDENNNRQITWNANKYKDGSYVPTYDYYFYYTEFGKKEYNLYPGNVSTISGGITNTSPKYTMKFVFPDESKMYSFIVIISNGSKIKFMGEMNGEIYEQQIVSADLSLVGRYVSENTIKLSWNPAKYTNDSVVPLSQYTVYAKEKGADDSEYKQVVTEIKYTRNNSGIYAEVEIVNNNVSYDFLVSYMNNNFIYQSRTRVPVYNKDTVQISNNIINFNWIAADTDELANDLEVIVALDENQELSSIRYETSSNEEEAILLAENGKALEFEKGYTYYVFTLKNVGDTTNCYTAIDVVVSEEGKIDNYVSKAIKYNAITNPVTVSDIKINCNNNDNMLDDVSFYVSANNINQKITIKYAVSQSQSTALKLLETSKVETLVTDLSGYKFYEFDANKYAVLRNIPTGNYFAVKIIVSETGKSDYEIEKVSNNCSAIGDNVTSPATINVSWKALDSEESIANDLHAIIETEINQTISGISYATATKEEYAADSSILNNRLNSKGAINVEIYNIYELYRTEDKIVYEFIKKDFDIGTYLILKVTTSENAKLDCQETKVTESPVIENIVEILDTAQPVISDNLKFTSANFDSNFNDIYLSDIDFRIDVSQKIESITYVYAETIEKAKELLISTSSEVQNVWIPQEYYLETSVQDGVSKLTKLYKPWETIWNVPAGNYVVLAVKVSQPGYNSVIKYVYTEAYYNDDAGYNVPAVATQREITSPVVFEVDDNKNYEYVKLVLQENYPYDSQSNYEYTLQRTLEKYYQEDNPIWEDISLDTTVYYGSGYEFYYADIPVGSNVYRLTKTRIATGESVVLDRKVVVSYYVDAPAITIGSYENGNIVINSTELIDNRYDRIDKYDYSLELVLPNGLVEKENCSWTVDSEYFDDNYTQYKLNATITDFDAIISKYNLFDFWGNPLNINVRLTKTRTIDTNYYDSESTNFYASKGISATVDNSIPTLELTATGNYFAATNGFDSYTWYVNGTEYIADGFNVTIPVYNFSYGQNTVMVVAKKGNITTSASVDYIKNR
ncbi:hypothetical protein SAMN02745152_02144 [Treponema berlinense]|uniref:Uncharacterized protein n=1 Tax=Treponema berlinense TaxID=225004 RepID=A0A1T4QWP2_9SPIR|nr:hypothetical protein [Treponema berlinense]SKA08075.1 hypothetical protein SAMN02745152_02144 [Treponema berlinense]